MDSKVVCEAFIIAWNRSDTIHLTILHYKQFCQRIVIFDNYSDDGTREIALSMGCDVRLFGTKGVLDDQAYVDVKNECWKSSKADWVVVCDDDEILYHHELSKHLEIATSQGSSIIPTQGYSMYSNDVPHGTWLDIKTGIIDTKYSKLAIFDPKKLKEIGYVYGCHEARPKPFKANTDLYCGAFIPLLHYHAVGGAQRMIDRHALYEPRRRRSEINMKWGLGKEYGYSAESKREWFKNQLERSKTLSFLGTGLQ